MLRRQRRSRWIALGFIIALIGSCGGSFSYEEPAETGDGWATATLAEVGLETAPFEDLMAEITDSDARAVHGILVVKDGALVFEKYFDGYRFEYNDPEFRGEPVEFDAETRHNLMSITKAVAGALVGIAVEEGSIAGVDEPVVQQFEQYAHLSDAAKDEITVEHLLTMTSGFEWNEWDVPLTDTENNDLIQLFIVDDPIEYIIAKPVVHDPGTYWYYSGGDVNLLGEYVEQATGIPIDEFSATHLFGPLGITDYEWQYLNPEVVYASGELEMRPRDLAKFGWLYANEGQWSGTEVISPEWVDASISEHASMPGRAADGDGYGYQWFLQTFEHDGASIDAAIRTGWGGQAVAVFPGLDTVVVLTGGDYIQQTHVSDLIGRYVVPAIAP